MNTKSLAVESIVHSNHPCSVPIEERFWSKVEMIPFHECWIWNGKLLPICKECYRQLWHRMYSKEDFRVSYRNYRRTLSKKETPQ